MVAIYEVNKVQKYTLKKDQNPGKSMVVLFIFFIVIDYELEVTSIVPVDYGDQSQKSSINLTCQERILLQSFAIQQSNSSGLPILSWLAALLVMMSVIIDLTDTELLINEKSRSWVPSILTVYLSLIQSDTLV